MPGWLKVVLGFLIFAIVGVYSYLGWIYFVKPQATSKVAQTVTKPVPVNTPPTAQKSQAKQYQGQIFCIKDTAKGGLLTSCEKLGILMTDDKYYEVIFESGANAKAFHELQNVKILGVLTDKPSTSGLPGWINVFEISGE